MSSNKASSTIKEIMTTSKKIGGENSTDIHQTSEKKNHETSQVCRDFVRGLCRRAKSCRYPHVQSADQVIFCHDFQNTGCARVNCRFLHYTLAQEEHYRQYGKLPCSNEPQQPEWANNYSRSNGNNNNLDGWNNVGGGHQYGMDRFPMDNNYPVNKRPRFNEQPPPSLLQSDDSKYNASYHNEMMAMMKRFEEEQSMLRRRVEVNEMKMAELQANNEYLMIHLRNCSRIVNPVTVTNTMTNSNQQQTTQVISTPVQVCATPQTQIIASSAPLAIQPTINTTQPISQIIGSQITLTPGITMTSQANVIMSQATQPIISYPVMTHIPH